MEKTRTRTQIKEHKSKRRIFFPAEPKPRNFLSHRKIQSPSSLIKASQQT